uniref:Calmodulin n=1 Tax=Trieres chinensis TaxID=1514140 RepID=A0A7S1ZH63_TRICV|mmetsp:Transcript_25533/g.52233  ORF Transcript_25533/g.52233 Transcript_25533/m.52233 type:complete len:617 (+) Transcript_25533:104-1954(+)
MNVQRLRQLENECNSTGKNESTLSLFTKSLRSHLLQQHHNRDPMLHFDVVRSLGAGSMGSVSQVRKRESAVGGSSRWHFVAMNGCLSMPIIGPLLKAFTGDLGRDKLWMSSEGGLQKPKQILAPQPIHEASLASFMDDEHCNTNYALKTIHLDCITDPCYVEELKNEIEVLKQLDHPNIVRAIETFDYSDQLFMVLELCSGGDLYARDPYTEDDAGRIVCSILSAVEYMHSKNITHRDLKYENIMFTSKDPDADVKIIDFGLSKKYGPGDSHIHHGVGTFYTMAPEVISGYYTNKADVWSVGVLAFMLLSSQMPFYANKKENVIRKILLGRYRMKSKTWKNISPSAKEFVKEMLQVDSKKRPSARAALQHPWLNRVHQERSNASREILEDVQAAMHRYAGYSTLKKLTLMVVSHKSTSGEIGFLHNVFRSFDSQQEGHITFPDFKEGLNNCGYNEEELVEMFLGADLDGTGVLNYTEFLASTIEAQGTISEQRLADAFDRLDSDDSGYISKENLREFLGHLPKNYIDKVVNEADLTRDDMISYKDFLAMWNCGKEGRQVSWRKVEKRESSYCSTSVTESSSCSENSFSADFDDFLLGEIQFQKKKEMSIRKYEIIC